MEPSRRAPCKGRAVPAAGLVWQRAGAGLVRYHAGPSRDRYEPIQCSPHVIALQPRCCWPRCSRGVLMIRAFSPAWFDGRWLSGTLVSSCLWWAYSPSLLHVVLALLVVVLAHIITLCLSSTMLPHPTALASLCSCHSGVWLLLSVRMRVQAP